MDVSLLALASIGPGLYCLVRGAVDVAEKRRLWGSVGLVIGLLAVALFLFGADLPPYAS